MTIGFSAATDVLVCPVIRPMERLRTKSKTLLKNISFNFISSFRRISIHPNFCRHDLPRIHIHLPFRSRMEPLLSYKYDPPISKKYQSPTTKFQMIANDSILENRKPLILHDGNGPDPASTCTFDLNWKTTDHKPMRAANRRKVSQLFHMAISNFDPRKVGLPNNLRI